MLTTIISKTNVEINLHEHTDIARRHEAIPKTQIKMMFNYKSTFPSSQLITSLTFNIKDS